jgi:hypothetical protein
MISKMTVDRTVDELLRGFEVAYQVLFISESHFYCFCRPKSAVIIVYCLWCLSQ